MSFASVAIIGAGHIGTSITGAASIKLPQTKVTLFDASADVRARARALGMTIADSAEDAVKDADLVILCVPVGAMGPAAELIGAAMKRGAILSDVGSVKASVISAVRPRDDVYFVPAHPLAGTERSGPDSGVPTLFENRWLILTPLADERAEYKAAVELLTAFWRSLGANVEIMDAQRHDMVLAVVSHLPHLIAYNIVAMAEELEEITEGEVVKYSASGFRDFTRIAASDPVMWRDVFLNNREAVLEVLGHFSETLTELQRAIRLSDGEKLHETFTRARRVRREIIEAGQDSAAPNFGRDAPKS